MSAGRGLWSSAGARWSSRAVVSDSFEDGSDDDVSAGEALYLQLPFAGESFEEYSATVLVGKLRPPPPAMAGAPEIPIVREEALRRGRSREPTERFPSIGNLERVAMEHGAHSWKGNGSVWVIRGSEDDLKSHRFYVSAMLQTCDHSEVEQSLKQRR